MGSFDSASAVDEIKFDLEAYGGPKGTVPEFTTEQLTKFEAAWSWIHERVAASEAGTEEFPSAEALAHTRQAISDLASNVVTPDDLAKLPPRVLAAFIRWIVSEVSPKD